MISAVLFDLDGTLRDSIGALRRAYHEFLADFGCVGSDAEFDALNGPSLSEIAARLTETHRLPLPLKELEKLFFDRQKRALAAGVPLHAGARELLGRLADRGVSLGLATSSPRDEVEGYLRDMRLTSFKVVVCGDDVERSKPDPALYNLAVRRVGEDAAHCAAVEDAPNGVISAKRAGLKVVAVSHHASPQLLQESGADAVATSLPEVLDALDLEGS
ncbi:MAG: HAD family hydrolase [Desulfovibrionaceae bacterium]